MITVASNARRLCFGKAADRLTSAADRVERQGRKVFDLNRRKKNISELIPSINCAPSPRSRDTQPRSYLPSARSPDHLCKESHYRPGARTGFYYFDRTEPTRRAFYN